MFEQLGYEGVEGTRRGVDDVDVDYMYEVVNWGVMYVVSEATWSTGGVELYPTNV